MVKRPLATHTAASPVLTSQAVPNQINALPTQAVRELGHAIFDLNNNRGVVLAMGCGAGRVALPMARDGVRIVGIEIDRRSHTACRAQLVGCAAIFLMEGLSMFACVWMVQGTTVENVQVGHEQLKAELRSWYPIQIPLKSGYGT
jgi:SAM-dependent methyltransferase